MTRTSYFGPATWPGQSSKAFRNDGRAPLAWRAFVNALFQTDWVVYVKPAFGGAPAVLRYLGRYTHRVAISNHRLLAFDGEHVTFWLAAGSLRPSTLAASIHASFHGHPQV